MPSKAHILADRHNAREPTGPRASGTDHPIARNEPNLRAHRPEVRGQARQTKPISRPGDLEPRAGVRNEANCSLWPGVAAASGACGACRWCFATCRRHRQAGASRCHSGPGGRPEAWSPGKGAGNDKQSQFLALATSNRGPARQTKPIGPGRTPAIADSGLAIGDSRQRGHRMSNKPNFHAHRPGVREQTRQTKPIFSAEIASPAFAREGLLRSSQ